MRRDVLYATVIDTAARVIALETIFSAYVAANERIQVHCEVMMEYYDEHIELLRSLSLALHDKPYSEGLQQLLIKKSLESKDRHDRLLNKQRQEEELHPM